MKQKPMILDPKKIRDISPDILDEKGRLRVMPASYYATTTIQERALFGARHAIYALPTEELVAWVKEQIGGRTALEIGSGNGVFAEALGIRATDNWMQADPIIRALYLAQGQMPVNYGTNVEVIDAHDAVAKYKPQVVVANWVTHKYSEKRAKAEGNMFGVVEEEIIDNCETYIFVGNRKVHEGKSIWSRPHVIYEPDWVYSRAGNGSPDFIAVWSGKK